MAAVFLFTLPVVSVILQLARGHWPGEGEPDNGFDDLTSGTLWRTRAVELLAVTAVLIVGLWVARAGLARLRPRAFHAIVLVAAGLAVSLPCAALVTNTADAAVADHLDDAWIKQMSSGPDLPPPTPPSPALAAVLWHPANPTPVPADLRGVPGMPYVASAVSPDACATRYGATDGARLSGIDGGVFIVERVVAFPDSHHAAAYMADPHNCRAVEGAVTVRTLPRIKLADAQSTWLSTYPGSSPTTYVRMRFGSIVVTGSLQATGTTATPAPVARSETIAAAMLLATAARP